MTDYNDAELLKPYSGQMSLNAGLCEPGDVVAYATRSGVEAMIHVDRRHVVPLPPDTWIAVVNGRRVVSLT